ncbi:MAG: GNAT family N-acetyltransferase [Planctomycetes bacterium]|nr:GNAT family N-acetyltransferase [Planctomycetota bacterium]MBI3834201.1 GNAT family N-acetyltransferase [Planctomycetota bacterium]
MSITIREATPADFETIVRFNLALSRESEGWELNPARVTEGVRAALADPMKARYFLAEIDGVVAGQTMVTTEWSDWRNGYFWWIQSVYVDAKFRRRGVYSALHQYIRDEARKHSDVGGLRLYVYHTNDPAMATYKKLGMHRASYHFYEEYF